MTINHGGPRRGSGPKTKAERGECKYKRLSITLPPNLWKTIEAKRKINEGNSALIVRLLRIILKENLT